MTLENGQQLFKANLLLKLIFRHARSLMWFIMLILVLLNSPKRKKSLSVKLIQMSPSLFLYYTLYLVSCALR